MENTTELKILIDVQNKMRDVWPRTTPGDVKIGHLEAIGVLPNGMSSGRPSVALFVTSSSGEKVMAETSLQNLQMAMAAFISKYGDVTDGAFQIVIGEHGMTVEIDKEVPTS